WSSDVCSSDLEVARIRFGELREQLEKARAAIEKHGRASKQAQEELEALGRIFAPFKLAQLQFDTLVSDIRSANDAIRGYERDIIRICTRDCKMPRKDFINQFPGNEATL